MSTISASSGLFVMNRSYVSSVSSSGLNDSQISEPSLRIVGMSTDHDRLLTDWASSTQTMSQPSNDLIESTVWSDRPENENSVPLAHRSSFSSTR
ncbi:hypothetical protein D9M72_577710 [compost metagenome]